MGISPVAAILLSYQTVPSRGYGDKAVDSTVTGIEQENR